MKLTYLDVGDVPEKLRGQFRTYPEMFANAFAAVGADIEVNHIAIAGGAPLPDPGELEAVLIPGSAKGVYDDTPWMEPLREFIRKAYEHRTPLLGICFGHQVMADALGGDVRKSEKGWGLGRHTYDVAADIQAASGFGANLSIAASHQDQVIAPPPVAKTWLSSSFTPHAGLIYDNGAAISVQPHPEFEVNYSKALCDLRLSDSFDQIKVDAAKATLDQPVDNNRAIRFLVDFLKQAR